MCDCYTDHCKVCNAPHEIHLEDFSTERNEIAVYCETCMTGLLGSPIQSNGILYEWEDEERQLNDGDPYETQPGGAVYIQSLTPNALTHADGNTPNVMNKTTQKRYGSLK